MPTPEELEARARARVGLQLDGKWNLEKLLGVGGMAAVYAARHRNGARAAVKVLHPEISRDEDVRARFLHEGKAANRVEHPGAVRVLDDDTVQAGPDQGTAYMVMELLEGESVFHRVRRTGTLAEGEVGRIADEVLAVLEAAHARGIVHRDLKPDNLFLVRGDDGRERVKVLDFGIARIADASRKTNVGTTLGTPSYMAPEQARGQRDRIDGRTDLFALGATMFRLLTGRRVHEGESPADVLAKMATEQAPPIRSVSEFVSLGMAAVIDRALRYERDERYADASAMRDDLRAAREGRPLPSGTSPREALGFLAGGAEVTQQGGRAIEPPTMTTAPASQLQVEAPPPSYVHEAPPPSEAPTLDAPTLEAKTTPLVTQAEIPKTLTRPLIEPVLPPTRVAFGGSANAEPIAEPVRRKPKWLFVGGGLGLAAALVVSAFFLLGSKAAPRSASQDELHEEAAKTDPEEAKSADPPRDVEPAPVDSASAPEPSAAAPTATVTKPVVTKPKVTPLSPTAPKPTPTSSPKGKPTSTPGKGKTK